MIDKRVIAVIVIFILGGLFIYSFANPMEDGDDYSNTGNSGIVTPGDKEEKPETIDQTALDEILDQLASLNKEDYTAESWDWMQNKIKDAQSQTTQEAFDKIVSQITFDQLIKNPVDPNPEPIGNPTGGSSSSTGNSRPNGGTGTGTGTNKPNGGSSSGNTNNGNNSGSNSGNNSGNNSNTGTKPVTINQAALDNIKAQLAKLKESNYTVASWQAIQDQIAVAELQVTQEKFDEEVAKIDLNTLQLRATATKIGVSLDKMGDSANIKTIKVNEQYYRYTGQMNTNTLTTEDGITIRDFIVIKIMSPEALSQTEKNNIQMVYEGMKIDASEFKVDANNQSYVEIYQPFSRSNDGSGSTDNLTTVSFTVNWGYGETKQYTITIDVAVN